MSNKMRELLRALHSEVDYNSPALRAQMNDIDVDRLHQIVDKAASRARVLLHAFDAMASGPLNHPVAAIMWATDYGNGGVPVSDDEFDAILRVWSRWCEAARYANSAVNVTPQTPVVGSSQG